MTEAQKPIRCLVIQLARLGDTIQSLMALRAAKQLYPQLEIHFLAREKFAAAAKRVPWIAQVHVLPTDELLSPILRGERTERQSLGQLARWSRPLIDETWDLLVNWSYSEASSWLTALLPARVKLGFTRNADGALSCTDGWSHYIQAIVQGKCAQNIHLTDILTTQLLTALQIHSGVPADEGDAAVTSRSFFTLELSDHEVTRRIPGWRDPSRKWIGIQLGAGEAAKTWPAESWAQVASYVLNRHPEYGIVLLGGPEDSERARQFMEWIQDTVPDPTQVISLVGKTSFDFWASVVSRCQWVMSGDTAAVHLASVLGTRVFNVSVGPVRWEETGPYGNGHYIVSSSRSCPACETGEAGAAASEHLCRSHVTPHAAYAAWSYAASEWAHRRQVPIESHFSQLGWSSELSNVRVHRARIRGTDEGGGVFYEAMIQRALRVGDWSSQVMGHVARAWYCGWVPKVGTELIRGTISTSLIQTLRGLDEASDVMVKVCEEARRTATTLHQKSSAMKSQKIMGLRDRDELSKLGQRLNELDLLVGRLAAAQPTLLPFSQMSKVMMHNLRGNHLSELSRETAISYEQLGQGIAILREWVQQTLNLAKPMAINSARSASASQESPERGLNA